MRNAEFYLFYSGSGVKTGAGNVNFDYERERDFGVLGG